MKIICIGRNYAAHAEELGNEIPKEPLFFLKPESALLPTGASFKLPPFSQDVHFECELVLRFGKSGKNISEENALSYVEAFTLGLDMTARDLQRELKARGNPWEKAKAFDGSAIVSKKWLPWSEFDLEKTRFSLHQNGELRQEGDPKLMIFPIQKLIAHVSTYMSIRGGDLMMTGTPKGVGQTLSGDKLSLTLNDSEVLSVAIE